MIRIVNYVLDCFGYKITLTKNSSIVNQYPTAKQHAEAINVMNGGAYTDSKWHAS